MQNGTDDFRGRVQNQSEMTVVLLIALMTSLTAWLVSLSTHRWGMQESGLGLMSQRWIAEQRDDESRHGPA